MKKLIITVAALLTAVAAYGQGSFFFNTHDTSGGNVVQFTFNGAPATGSDLWVEVLAGKDANSLVALPGLLPLNRTGAGAGYTQPFSATYNVTDAIGGTAVVGYRAFQGTSFATATAVSSLQLATSPVTLAVAPTPPNEVALGTVTVAIVPEPAAIALGLIGLGGREQKKRKSR